VEFAERYWEFVVPLPVLAVCLVIYAFRDHALIKASACFLLALFLVQFVVSALDVYVFAKPNSMLFAPGFTLLLFALEDMVGAGVTSVGFALMLAARGASHLRPNRLLISSLISALAVTLALYLLHPFLKLGSEYWASVGLQAVVCIALGATAAGIFVSLQIPSRRAG
jgi:hypothetical protein